MIMLIDWVEYHIDTIYDPGRSFRSTLRPEIFRASPACEMRRNTTAEENVSSVKQRSGALFWDPERCFSVALNDTTNDNGNY